MRGSMAAAALSEPRSAGALQSLTVRPSTSRTRFALYPAAEENQLLGRLCGRNSQTSVTVVHWYKGGQHKQTHNEP